MKPEVGQRREKDGEIPSAVAGKESGNVLNEDKPSGANKLIGASGELEEEAAALPGESSPLPRDAEVLAGEPSADEIDGPGVPGMPRSVCAPACLPDAAVRLGSSVRSGRSPSSRPLRAYTSGSTITSSQLVIVGAASASAVESVSRRWPLSGDEPDVGADGDAGESVCEDPSAEGVGLALERDAPSGALEPEVEAADSAEERGDDGLVTHFPSWSGRWRAR